MAEKESFEKIIRRIAGIIDSMEKEAKARGKKVTSTKKKTPETEPEETKKVKKVTTTEEETPEVTPAKKKTPVKKTEPINANIFGIPLGEKKTPAKKKLTEAVNVLSGNQVSQGVNKGTGDSKPKKTKEEKTQRTLVSRATELSRVYTKPSKVQEMHRRRRKSGKSFTRQGASKLIDKTDKITIYNMNKADKAVESRFTGKKYEKDLTSGGSRGSALTATGGSRVEYENKPGDKPGKAWIKTSKIPSITKQKELYRQNRKRNKKGR